MSVTVPFTAFSFRERLLLAAFCDSFSFDKMASTAPSPPIYDSFICGFAYGTTTVIVGQPFDTIKTRQQAYDSKAGLISTFRSIYNAEGIRGLYRGGVPLVMGGALMRSAQFGVYEFALSKMREQQKGPPIQKLFGVIDPQVVMAGFAGGISRGIVEGPFEYIKVRRQVQQSWKFSEVLNGSGATIFRNGFLFSSFVVYMDLTKQFIPGGLSPFLLGAFCSNMAWLTIWPLDVVKSQLQSGNYAGKDVMVICVHLNTSTSLFPL